MVFGDMDLDEKDERPSLNLNVKYTYPTDPEYNFEAELVRLNYDEERDRDITSGKGFIISSPKATIKKDIKNPDGIFSNKFGQRLGDMNPFVDRYSCQCGSLKSRVNHGIECDKCHTICKYVDDDFSMFGWIVLKPEYAIIHPDIYRNLDSLFGRSKYNKNSKKKKGSKLQNIIDYDIDIDVNGHEMSQKVKADEPFYGIGMLDFIERFDEILEYYYKKNPKKKDLYDDIIADRSKVFIHSIPVYTTHLRSVNVADATMYYEKTTGMYNMMVKLASHINKNKTKIDRTPKLKNQQLFNLQMKFLELYDEIVGIISGKKGNLRMLVGGRFNFSARAVIKQDPSLRIDQVKLPYAELVIVLEPQIINILHRTYNISFQEAYDKWYKSISTMDPVIREIIMSIIKSSGEGIPVIINRPPTINYGGIMQMFCIGINDNYCMSVPLQILPPLAADFDGDTLSQFFIINQAFFQRAYEVFNPRNAMYISKNDGMCNKDVIYQKDTIINANTLIQLGRKHYAQEELDAVAKIKELNKVKIQG